MQSYHLLSNKHDPHMAEYRLGRAMRSIGATLHMASSPREHTKREEFPRQTTTDSEKEMKKDPFAPDLLARLPALPHKIVLLRASRIGDFLCAVPAMRALRARLPDAEISMLPAPTPRPGPAPASPGSRLVIPRFPGSRRPVL